MKTMLTFLRDTHSSDDADGNIIAAMLFLPMMFFMGLAAVDAGMFFVSMTSINNAARDGANNVSSVAGSGSMSAVSDMESGLFESKSRSELSSPPAGWTERGWDPVSAENSQEYLLLDTLANRSNTYRVEITDVQCGVENAGSGTTNGEYVVSLDDRPYCEVEWRYQGMPFSAFGVFVPSDDVRDTRSSVPAEVTIGTPAQQPDLGLSNYTRAREQ